jgi:hypothetical protein
MLAQRRRSVLSDPTPTVSAWHHSPNPCADGAVLTRSGCGGGPAGCSCEAPWSSTPRQPISEARSARSPWSTPAPEPSCSRASSPPASRSTRLRQRSTGSPTILLRGRRRWSTSSPGFAARSGSGLCWPTTLHTTATRSDVTLSACDSIWAAWEPPAPGRASCGPAPTLAEAPGWLSRAATGPLATPWLPPRSSASSRPQACAWVHCGRLALPTAGSARPYPCRVAHVCSRGPFPWRVAIASSGWTYLGAIAMVCCDGPLPAAIGRTIAPHGASLPCRAMVARYGVRQWWSEMIARHASALAISRHPCRLRC